jgi:hypothetical protein
MLTKAINCVQAHAKIGKVKNILKKILIQAPLNIMGDFFLPLWEQVWALLQERQEDCLAEQQAELAIWLQAHLKAPQIWLLSD